MEVLILLASLIGGLISSSRCASAIQCEVSLPQNSDAECMAIRNAVLAKNKETFTLKQAPYGFARLNMTIPELGAAAIADPFSRYYTQTYVGMTQANRKILEKYNNATFGQEITNLMEYLKISDFFQAALQPVIGDQVRLASANEAFQDDKTEWISDKFFTQQRLAGSNPLSIKRVTIHGEGLDWNELKKTLNPEFDWEGAVQEALNTKKKVSLENAIKQGRIYALRYELCDDMERSPDLTDRDPRRTMWNFLSPIALFASAKKGRRSNELVPVAIQMDYKPESAVYTPKDGGNWMLAKLNVQITDIGYAQIAEHLARVHFFVEPFCVSLKRTLPPAHPLNQILKYHCREVIVPNTFGDPVLLGDTGFATVLFAYGQQGAMRLLKDIHPLTTWEMTDYRKNIKNRGLHDKKLLPYFPFRDDGIKILEVIERLVKDYVDLYYKKDKDVSDDVELQAYLNEVSLDGTGPNGGIGRIQGLPAAIDSKDELRDILSRFIGHVTIYHASVNYLVTDYPEYIPAQPTKLYDDTRVQDGEFSIHRLPNRLTTAVQSSAFLSLGALRIDTLFDYGNELDDTDAGNLVNGYYSYLMLKIQPRMQKENEKRKGKGQLTYPYFIPKWLPNGIQT